MASSNPVFLRLWRHEKIRNNLLPFLDTDSLCALRLTEFEISEQTAPVLFSRTHLTFKPNSFTRPSAIVALKRIGHYIQHFTFYMPHVSSTLLAPLVHPVTGKEINFLYTPHTTIPSPLERQRPQYGSSDLEEILTQQYPPFFHAATDVPSFIRAMECMPNLRHLTIRCPDQDPAERYRRSAVDYALISLRIAVEHAPLIKLEKLSLSPIHPSALNYLRHMPGFGSSPIAGRRWRQIRKLNITMDSWDFYGPRPGLDHLKILDDFIRSFSSSVEKVRFSWSGRRGPCPFSLSMDPLFAPPPETSKLFGELTSPMSPLPAAPSRRPIVLPKLRYMHLRNCSMSSQQVSTFVSDHKNTAHDFDFVNVILTDDVSWDDAFACLTNTRGSSSWHSSNSGGSPSSNNHSGSGSSTNIPSDNDDHSFKSCASQPSLERIYSSDCPEVIDTLPTPPRPITVHQRPVTPTPTLNKLKKKRRVRRKRVHHSPPPQPVEYDVAESAAVQQLSASAMPEAASAAMEASRALQAEIFNWAGNGTGSPTRGSAEYLQQQNLQPTVVADDEDEMDISSPMLLQPTTFVPNMHVQGVQRDLEKEEKAMRLGYDTDSRMSALRKAKEVVMARFGKKTVGRCKVASGFEGGGVRHKNAVSCLRSEFDGGFGGLLNLGYGDSDDTGGLRVDSLGVMENRTQLVPLMYFS